MLTSIGGLPLVRPDPTQLRLTCLIWGQVGVGKTPLAITAPAPILYILFDPDGEKSVIHVRDRYELLDLTKADASIVDQLYKPDTLVCRDIDKALASGQFKSVVFDSVTSYFDKCQERGVIEAAKTVTKGVKPTFITPGLAGYGARGVLMKMTINNLHHLCSKHNVNLILTGHEKTEVDSDGSIRQITISLGGDPAVAIPKAVSELWLLRDYERRKRIYVRNWNKYSPMRTRMFLCDDTSQEYFPLSFNANTWEGEGLEQWLNQWRSNGGNKIPMPK